MDKTLNVFILAAGIGERLQPITYHIPKPLLPILGKPVLQSVLEKVLTLPVNRIGINLYHKKEAIKNWISQSAFSKKVELFPEESILGTGGALKNAEAFLSKSTFLVHNSDIVSDIDLAKLVESHVSSGNLVTLAVHDFPEFNNLATDEKGFLRGVGNGYSLQTGTVNPIRKQGRGVFSNGVKWLAFTGIAVYEPEFLKFLSKGISSVVDGWGKALSAGYKVGTLDVSGCYWSDTGTPSAYFSAVFDVLRADGEMIYIHPSTEGCEHVEMDGYVVIEKQSIFDKGVSLRNCIMLPGSQAGSKLHYENCILGPGFKIDLSESETLGLLRTKTLVRGLSGEGGALLIGTGGSDRKYYRVRKNKKSAVLMHCSDNDPDFMRQIEYTRFFLRHSIPVPELIEIEPDKMTAVFEDMGCLSLYSWLKCPREKGQIERTYRQVIDILVLIHTVATEYVSECQLLQNRVFDYEHLRWETGYFIERFVESIRNIRVKNPSVLNKEFHELALKAASFPKTVIHRDFQSQNIMITKGETLRLIDYQGARVGPPAYDVVSILWDPYYPLENDMRENLLNYYIDVMINRVRKKFNENDFRETLLSCRLQRHMQVLGAYSFLSAIKGKKYFLKFVPEGLRLLKEDVSLAKGEYPELYVLVIGQLLSEIS